MNLRATVRHTNSPRVVADDDARTRLSRREAAAGHSQVYCSILRVVAAALNGTCKACDPASAETFNPTLDIRHEIVGIDRARIIRKRLAIHGKDAR